MKERGKTKLKKKTFSVTYVLMTFKRPLVVHQNVNNVGPYIEICMLQIPFFQPCGQAYVSVTRARGEALGTSQRTRGAEVDKTLALVFKHKPVRWLSQSFRQLDEIYTGTQEAKLVPSPEKTANWCKWCLWWCEFYGYIKFNKIFSVRHRFVTQSYAITTSSCIFYIFFFVIF